MPTNNLEEVLKKEVNKDSIVITKQEDGNWKGFMIKFGKVVDARQADPIIVLQMLLTHPGK